MEWLSVTLEMYRRVFMRAATLALSNWPVLGSVFAYGAIVTVTSYVAVFLGIAAGFLMGFVIAACVGSFLYLVEMMVRTNRVSWEDFRRSFGAYVWDVIGVLFVLWMWQLASQMLLQTPQAFVVVMCINILILVLFNAVPELIYLGHHSLMALLSESYRFVAENWIEWFPPNILAMVALAFLWQLPASNVGTSIIQIAVVSLFVYFVMVLRGLLFLELAATSRRARLFRHRSGR